jgi:hypothetical protein
MNAKVLPMAREIDNGPYQAPGLDPKIVLKELFELLEDYGPGWYTEDHHDRAVAALRKCS